MTTVTPVKYDANAHKHEPFATGDNLPVSAIPIDPDSNNLLRATDNGLLVEIAAAPNVQNQYVSSSTGNDSNDGTEASPLKTIRYAVSRLPDNTSGNIYLKAGDTFSPEDGATTFNPTGTQGDITHGAIYMGNRSLAFYPYGDAQYDKIVSTPGAVAGAFDGVNQPIIQYTVRKASDTTFTVCPGFSWGNGTLNFTQITHKVLDPNNFMNGTAAGGAECAPFTSATGPLTLSGCDITLCYLALVSATVSATAPVVFTNAKIDTTNGNALMVGNGYRVSYEYSDSASTPSFISGSNWRGTNINAAIGTTASFPGVTVISADARTYEGLVTTNKITQA